MDLKWCKYNNKYELLLDLGAYNGKMCCVKCSLLSEPQIRILRANHARLSKMDIPSIVKWISDNMPEVMNAYRTISLDSITVHNDYKITPP